MGHFKNDVPVLTGSLSMFVKGEVETFPGRREVSRIHLSLTFIFMKPFG
jgi:predicted AAA+ superfamily ATPase